MQLERPKSLSALATEHIRDAIILGELGLGESLSEVALSKRLGISKTPIREALAALRLQGLVDFVPQKGAFVFCLSSDQVRHLCGYRYMLETNALDMAMERDPSALLSDLTRICTEMSDMLKANEFARYLQLDADFHDSFFEHCGNEFLHNGYGTVRDIVATMRTHLSKHPDRTAKSYAEHASILEAVNTGNITKVKSVLKKQITRGERAYADLSGQFQRRAALKVVER